MSVKWIIPVRWHCKKFNAVFLKVNSKLLFAWHISQCNEHNLDQGGLGGMFGVDWGMEGLVYVGHWRGDPPPPNPPLPPPHVVLCSPWQWKIWWPQVGLNSGVLLPLESLVNINGPRPWDASFTGKAAGVTCFGGWPQKQITNNK